MDINTGLQEIIQLPKHCSPLFVADLYYLDVDFLLADPVLLVLVFERDVPAAFLTEPGDFPEDFLAVPFRRVLLRCETAYLFNRPTASAVNKSSASYSSSRVFFN